MSTRITQSMLNSQLMRNVNTNLKRMEAQQNQLSSGMRINKPSDDPVGITYAMRYRQELAANEQYQLNVDHAGSWLNHADIMLNQAGELIQRTRDLAVQGANGTNSQSSMEAIRSEVMSLYTQMVDIGNSEFNGKYIFNGQKTDIPPYTPENAQAENTDSAGVRFAVSPGTTLQVTIPGNQVFGSPGDHDNLFKVFKELMAHLGASDHEKISNVIGKLDSRFNQMLATRSEIGAKTNQTDLASQRLEDINLDLQRLKSKNEDADLAEVITNLKMNENIYQASLSAGARLIQPSLLDFLR